MKPRILHNITQLDLQDFHDLTVFMNLYAKHAENKNNQHYGQITEKYFHYNWS